MYTPELTLSEKIAIVERTILLDLSIEDEHYVMIPDNHAEIIIPLNQDLQFRCNGSVRSLRLEVGKGYFLMPRRRGATIDKSALGQCIILKVHPVFARKMAHQLQELSNGVFDLALSSMLIHRIMNAMNQEDRYLLSEILEQFFATHQDLFDHNLTIMLSIEQIKESCGTVSVQDLYSGLEISKSKLEQHFNKELGLTPKEYCKIEKINCFLRAFMQNRKMNLTELTYQCGYYDQSHLIKDFKYFLDDSPKRFFSKNLSVI